MFCIKCGNKLSENAGFCHKCGAKVILPNMETEQQSLIVPVDATASPPNTPVVTPPPTMPATHYVPPNALFPDRRQQGIIGLCKVAFALRLVIAIVWILIIVLQIWDGVDFWLIVWNIVATVITCYLAAQLFGVISSNSFNSVRIRRVVDNNIFLAIIGVVFYGWQFFSDGVLSMFLFIGLELTILVMMAIAYFSVGLIVKETIPVKDMNVVLENDEAVILKDNCTRILKIQRQSELDIKIQMSTGKIAYKDVSYSGAGTLTNKRFVFISNAEWTRELVEDTYGDGAIHQFITDETILLSEIVKVEETKESKTNDNVKTLVIQTRAGTSYTFAFDAKIKDAWTDGFKWLHAFENAIKK